MFNRLSAYRSRTPAPANGKFEVTTKRPSGSNFRNFGHTAWRRFVEAFRGVKLPVEKRFRPEVLEFVKQPQFQGQLEPSMLDGSLMKSYTLKDYLGGGSFGQVFSAQRNHTNINVTIKFMVRGKEDVPDEVKFMKMLKHPNIVEYRCHYMTDDFVQLVMNNYGRKTMSLATYSEQTVCMSERMLTGFAKQMMTGLHHMHTSNIAHMDIKEDNFIINEKLEIKIIDFGISLEAREVDQDVPYEHAQGTFEYMSPECSYGLGYYGKEVDMWAFGVVIYHMLTGEYPFDLDVKGHIILTSEHYRPIKRFISRDLLDLFGKIFTSPRPRMSSSEALAHRWMAGSSFKGIPSKYYDAFK